MSDKKQSLTEEQAKEMFALNTAEEVIDYGKKHGFEIPQEEAEKVAAALPEDLLEDVAGGTQKIKIDIPVLINPMIYPPCTNCQEHRVTRHKGILRCLSCGWTETP